MKTISQPIKQNQLNRIATLELTQTLSLNLWNLDNFLPMEPKNRAQSFPLGSIGLCLHFTSVLKQELHYKGAGLRSEEIKFEVKRSFAMELLAKIL